MTVDSAVIFATAEANGDAPRVRGLPRLDGGSLARRTPSGLALPRARRGTAALIGTSRRELFFASTAEALEITERYTGVSPAQARACGGTLLA
jgi:hypothetical protein